MPALIWLASILSFAILFVSTISALRLPAKLQT
jgi:hypothetical protein